VRASSALSSTGIWFFTDWPTSNGGLTLRPIFDAQAFDAGRIFSATSICIMSFLGFDARDRQLPSVLARIHPRYHTPYVGMVFTAILSLAVALLMKNRLDDLASIVNLAGRRIALRRYSQYKAAAGIAGAAVAFCR
jgi:predicted LPLAT superfamily acyltransferase